MPTYEYRCSGCGVRLEKKRLFSEMDALVECPDCGADCRRVFSPNGNIHIPIHMQMKHGGGLSWSDFHDETERELAHVEGVERVNVMRSQSGSQAIQRRKEERRGKSSRNTGREAGSEAVPG